MTKDILVIRLSNNYSAISPKHFKIIEKRINKKFKKLYNIIVFMGENETTKTTVEIIKY